MFSSPIKVIGNPIASSISLYYYKVSVGRYAYMSICRISGEREGHF